MNLSPETSNKLCRVCKSSFLPFRSTQVVCSGKCAGKVGILDRKQTKERLQAMKPLSYWVKQAQTAFNAYVRTRDAKLPCVSCGCTTAVQWHAGHYYTVGARPELRFDEKNCWKQCSQCNDYLSGNVANYRKELLCRIGAQGLQQLEAPSELKRYRADDLKAITALYRAKLKALKEKT